MSQAVLSIQLINAGSSNEFLEALHLDTLSPETNRKCL